jgi:iron(III) transport system permease protein
MMIPHLLFSVSWALLLNPSNGMINTVLKGALGLDGAPFNIYTLEGMILVEALLDLPVAYLIIAPAMASFGWRSPRAYSAPARGARCCA